jgi:hypothetical protein
MNTADPRATTDPQRAVPWEPAAIPCEACVSRDFTAI